MMSWEGVPVQGVGPIHEKLSVRPRGTYIWVGSYELR